MHKKFIFAYLSILVVLLVSLSLSKPAAEKLRSHSASLFAPLWEHVLQGKNAFSYQSEAEREKLSLQEEALHLQLENQLLRTEIADLHHLLHSRKKIEIQGEQLNRMGFTEISDTLNDFEKALNRSFTHFQRHVKVLAGRVIFRSFDQWNSSIWINIGKADNEKDQPPIVAKRSPVLIGQSVVGMVDYVGEHQSRVRLITDATLTPSVRAARGGEYDGLVTDYINNVLYGINPKIAFSLNEDEYQHLQRLLNKLKKSFQPFKKSWYLAKGELQGSLSPLGYGPCILKGTGFNYDFADEEGESRDLRTGKINSNSKESALPILKVGDVLVTTGMDGVFPPGLQVAIVTKIQSLKEGDYFYELEAKPVADNLAELSLVFVIPPMQSEEEFIK